MRFLPFYLFLLLFTQYRAGSADIKSVPYKFLGTNIANDNLVLTFSPLTPSYSTIYSSKQNGSEIRWEADVDTPVYKVYEFTNNNSPFKKVIVWADPKKKRGILQIWHRGDNQFTLTQPKNGQLSLSIKLRETRQLTQSVPRKKVVSRGPIINLNVKDAPLAKIIRTIASESNKSLVFGSEVEGNVTVNIRNQPYEDAMDTLLKPTKYRAEHTAESTVIRNGKDGKSFKVFKLQYADVNGVLKVIQDLIKDGQASMDSHSNAIFVSDTVENLVSIERIIATLDNAPKQVEVESAIIELQDSNSTEIGFDINGVVKSGAQIGEQVVNDISSTRISPFDPAAAAPKGMFVGLTWKSVRGILGMLNQNGKLTVLARPRVLALNDQEASILIGDKIGYKTVTVSATGGAVEDVKFLTVGTQLKIKPHITSNNDVIMQINPEVSDGALDPVTRVPNEKTTSSQTKVIVKDGQTVVIGGLLRDRTERIETKVPILGDIPLLGFFFKGTTETTIKSEIMILLSPKIVNQEVLLQQEREGNAMVDKIYKRRINSLPPPKRAH